MAYLVHILCRNAINITPCYAKKEPRSQFAVRIQNMAVKGETCQIFILIYRQLVIIRFIYHTSLATPEIILGKVLHIADMDTCINGGAVC